MLSDAVRVFYFIHHAITKRKCYVICWLEAHVMDLKQRLDDVNESCSMLSTYVGTYICSL